MLGSVADIFSINYYWAVVQELVYPCEEGEMP